MPQFICILEPTRADMPDNPSKQEAAAAASHFAYYEKLKSRGSLILAGRTQEPPHMGIAIFEAPTKEDAISLAAQDPAVISGVFTCRVQSYQVALSK